MPTRRSLYAQLGIAKRGLDWTEGRYRKHLVAHGAKDHKGRPSASTMTFAQIEDALAGMRDAGWHKALPNSILGRCRRAHVAQWRKIIAIWCALADNGAVRERGEPAMLKWCARQIREARPEWADAASLNRCIEGLKDWAARSKVELR